MMAVCHYDERQVMYLFTKTPKLPNRPVFAPLQPPRLPLPKNTDAGSGLPQGPF